MRSPRSLRGRLALWHALVVSAVLLAFAGTIYAVIEAEEAKEPPEVAALEPPDQTGAHVLRALALALPLALVVAVGGGLLVSRRALRGLEEVGRTAGELGADSLSRRIAVRPDDAEEIARVASALNDMLDRLERSVAGMRRFTQDASHELRTPLAVLMGEIEVTLRRPRDAAQLTGTLEASLDELGRLARLVDSLLVLAHSDGGQLALDAAEVDAEGVTRGALEPYEAVLADRGVSVTWRSEGPALVRADPLWLGRAVANLVDNAAKFTSPGGRVDAAVVARGARVEIVIGNSGDGIAAEDLPRIFERFYRGKAARGSTSGFGLGLALARDIARACGGELVGRNRDGGGAEFTLALPAVPVRLSAA